MENAGFLLQLEAETKAAIEARPIAAIDRILEALHGISALRKSAESLSRLRRLFDQAVLAVVNARSSTLKPHWQVDRMCLTKRNLSREVIMG